MPGGARPQGLSRRHRFVARGSFGPVLGAARKVRGALAVVHAVPGSAGRSRLGVALTRRLVPSSVERNRVKRVVREVFRRHAVKHAGVDCVVALRAGKKITYDAANMRVTNDANANDYLRRTTGMPTRSSQI